MSSGTKVAEMIGLAIAPFIISTLGLGGAVAIDALTFLICGLLIISIKIKDNVLSNEKLTIKSYFIDLKEGFSYVKKDRLILNLIVFTAIINGLFVPYNALQVPYIEEVLHSGSIAMSIMSIAILAGITISTVIAPKIKEKFGARNMFIIGGVLFGITYYSLSCFSVLSQIGIYIALAMSSFIGGFGILLVNFPLQIVLLKSVPQEYLPRVAAILTAGSLCAAPIASCITGVVSKFVSINNIYIIVGISTILLFILQYFNNNIKRFNEY